jgi:glycosyltransferase involved in cell wall biosynthesis
MYTDKPIVSVVIATYNSAHLLQNTIDAINRQIGNGTEYDVEILAIDGGSTDETISVASHLGAQIFENPDGHAIAAKWIGFNEASGDYICFLDHDEVLESSSSIKHKLSLFARHVRLRAVLTSGYNLHKDDATSNCYSSEFGDPLSFFRYRMPNNSRLRHRLFKTRLRVAWDEKLATGFLAGSETRPIMCELVASGSMVNRKYLAAAYPELAIQQNLIPHLYFLLNSQHSDESEIAVMVDDPIGHQTASTWRDVFRKTRWKVSNATQNLSQIMESGITGRQKMERKKGFSRIKLALRSNLSFAFYVFTVVPIAIDAIYLSISRRRIGYLMHVFVGLYVVAIFIMFVFTRKLDKFKRNLRYDGTSFD